MIITARRFVERSTPTAARSQVVENVRLASAEDDHRPAQLEGMKVFTNDGTDRGLREWVGTAENVRRAGDHLVGDIRLREKSGQYPAMREAFDRFEGHLKFTVESEGIVISPSQSRSRWDGREATSPPIVGQQLMSAVRAVFGPTPRGRFVEQLVGNASNVQDARLDNAALDKLSRPDAAAEREATRQAIEEILRDNNLSIEMKSTEILAMLLQWLNPGDHTDVDQELGAAQVSESVDGATYETQFFERARQAPATTASYESQFTRRAELARLQILEEQTRVC